MEQRHKSRRSVIAGVLALAVIAGLAVPALAKDGSVVTRGDFATFASGTELGYDVNGHAKMVRKANGTKVTIHVTGLDANETYVSHVHNQACSDEQAGGHFKQDPGAQEPGASEPPNEIWPGDGPFSSNPAGIANQKATVLTSRTATLARSLST